MLSQQRDILVHNNTLCSCQDNVHTDGEARRAKAEHHWLDQVVDFIRQSGPVTSTQSSSKCFSRFRRDCMFLLKFCTVASGTQWPSCAENLSTALLFLNNKACFPIFNWTSSSYVMVAVFDHYHHCSPQSPQLPQLFQQ